MTTLLIREADAAVIFIAVTLVALWHRFISRREEHSPRQVTALHDLRTARIWSSIVGNSAFVLAWILLFIRARDFDLTRLVAVFCVASLAFLALPFSPLVRARQHAHQLFVILQLVAFLSVLYASDAIPPGSGIHPLILALAMAGTAGCGLAWFGQPS